MELESFARINMPGSSAIGVTGGKFGDFLITVRGGSATTLIVPHRHTETNAAKHTTGFRMFHPTLIATTFFRVSRPLASVDHRVGDAPATQ